MDPKYESSEVDSEKTVSNDEEDEEGRDAEEDEALTDMRIRTYHTLDQFLTAKREDNSRETDTGAGTKGNPICCDTTSEATEEDRSQIQGQSGEEDDDDDDDDDDDYYVGDHVPQTQKELQTRGQKQKTQTQQFSERAVINCDLYWVNQTGDLQHIDKAENIPSLSSAELKKAEGFLQCTKLWGSCTRQKIRVLPSTWKEVYFAFLIVVPRKDQKNDDLFPQPFYVFHPAIHQRNSFRLEEIPNKGLGLKTCGFVPQYAPVVPSWPPMAVLVEPPGVPFCCDLPNVNEEIIRYIFTDDYGKWAAVPAKLKEFKEGRLQMEIGLDPTETRHLHYFMMANSSKQESMPTMAKRYATLTDLTLEGKTISATAFLLVANRDLKDGKEGTHRYEYKKQIQKLDAAKNAKKTMTQQEQEDTFNDVEQSATETPAKRKLGQEHTAKRKLGQERNAEATREVTSTQLHDTQVFAALYNEYDKAEKNMQLKVKAADERTEAQKAVTNWWKSQFQNAEQTMRSLAWSNIALTKDNRIHKRQQRAVIRASHTEDELKRKLAESEAKIAQVTSQLTFQLNAERLKVQKAEAEKTAMKAALAKRDAEIAQLKLAQEVAKKPKMSLGIHQPPPMPASLPRLTSSWGSPSPNHDSSPAPSRVDLVPQHPLTFPTLRQPPSRGNLQLQAAAKGTPSYTPGLQHSTGKMIFSEIPPRKPSSKSPGSSRMHLEPVPPFTSGSPLQIHGGSPAQLRIPSAPEASKGTPRYTPVPQDGPKNQAKYNKLNFVQMPSHTDHPRP